MRKKKLFYTSTLEITQPLPRESKTISVMQGEEHPSRADSRLLRVYLPVKSRLGF